MTTKPSFIETATAPEDQLAAIRARIAEARELEQLIADLEERLKAATTRLNSLQFIELPDLMNAAGVSAVTLPAEGNAPTIEAKAVPFYRANIAAGWPEDRRQEAFATLKEFGAEALIKTEVSIAFPRGSHEEAQVFQEEALKRGMNATLAEAVPHASLTAWLKDHIESHRPWPPLDKIGATVGRRVTLKIKGE